MAESAGMLERHRRLRRRDRRQPGRRRDGVGLVHIVVRLGPAGVVNEEEESMELPLQIVTRDIELSNDDEALIRKHAGQLDQYYRRITGVRVMVEVPNRRMGEPIAYHVRFDITVPGGEVLAGRRASPTLRTAIVRAFSAARRRLQDYGPLQRGDVKKRTPSKRRP